MSALSDRLSGSSSASSLVKSASSIASQVAAYNDAVQAAEWDSSAKTDADYNAYSKYLDTRITNLQGTGTLSSASKALSLSNTLRSANHTYISAKITNLADDIIEGSATLSDKRSAVLQYYQQAVANGDYSLAESLRGTYDTIDKEMQTEAQASATAATELAKTNATAQAEGYKDAATALGTKMNELSTDFSAGGQGVVTKSLQKFVSDNADTLKSLGVSVGSAPTNGSVIEGVIRAMVNYYAKAAQATASTDSVTSNNYLKTAQAYANSEKSVDFGNAKFTLAQATYYAEHPDAYYLKSSGTGVIGFQNNQPVYGTTYQLSAAPINGYTFSKDGTITPVFSKDGKTSYETLSSAEKTQVASDLKSAGLNATVASNGMITAETSKNSSATNKLMGSLGLGTGMNQVVVNKTSQGYQFMQMDANGNQHLYTLSKDSAGKTGIYQESLQGNQVVYNLVSSDKGFDTIQNSTNSSQMSAMNTDLQTMLKDYQSKGNGYTESKVIPTIANKYFGGDKNYAATAVYSYRKSMDEGIGRSVASLGGKSIINKVQGTNGEGFDFTLNLGNLINGAEQQSKARIAAAEATQKQAEAARIAQATSVTQALQNGKYNTDAALQKANDIMANGNNITINQKAASQASSNSAINGALVGLFANYKEQAPGYTENYVLPTIAKQFFGGNIKAASTPVYQYRQQTFGE